MVNGYLHISYDWYNILIKFLNIRSGNLCSALIQRPSKGVSTCRKFSWHLTRKYLEKYTRMWQFSVIKIIVLSLSSSFCYEFWIRNVKWPLASPIPHLPSHQYQRGLISLFIMEYNGISTDTTCLFSIWPHLHKYIPIPVILDRMQPLRLTRD